MLHAGSANLNNRSMGLDSECDLSVEASPDNRNSETVQCVIRKLLVRSIACHLGKGFEEVDSTLIRTGGLIQCIDELESPEYGRLHTVKPPSPSRIRELIGERQFFDPQGTRDNWHPWRRAKLLRL